MRDDRDILAKLKWLEADMDAMATPGEWLLPVREAHSVIAQLRHTIERLQTIAAAATPRPLEDTSPKDRVLIGVERPPYEEKTYYSMIRWVEKEQRYMAECGYDLDTKKQRFAFCSVSHYLDPLKLPGLPYWEGFDEDEEESDA